MLLDAAATSDIGKVRARNEDSFMLRPDLRVFAVADGMGGHAAGDVASRLAIEAITEHLEHARDEHAVLEAVRRANLQVWQSAESISVRHGMGCTLTVLAFDPNNSRAVAGHVGDSRIYLLRGKQLTQLTTDHAISANILLRAVGTNPDVDVDTLDIDVAPGDRFLICSDGLTGVVGHGDLRAILSQDKPMQQICDELVEVANLRGGPDNITAVVIAVVSDPSTPPSP